MYLLENVGPSYSSIAKINKNIIKLFNMCPKNSLNEWNVFLNSELIRLNISENFEKVE